MNGGKTPPGVELDMKSPYKVIQAPRALGLIACVFQRSMSSSIRLIAQCATLEEAQEIAYMENADEPAPDKNDFRAFHIIEFHGWEKPWRVHK